jgi:hypothetical protein
MNDLRTVCNPPDRWETSTEPAANISISVPIATTQQPASISLAEVIQDVTKWVAYDPLLPADITDQVPFLVALQYGALSGLAGNAVFELLKANAGDKEPTHIHHRDDDDNDNDDNTSMTETKKKKKEEEDEFQRVFRSFRKISVRFLRAGLEGGALFASYEGTVNFFDNSNKSLPPEVQAFFTTKFSDMVDDLKRLVAPS